MGVSDMVSPPYGSIIDQTAVDCKEVNVEWNPVRDHNLQALLIEMSEEIERKRRGTKKPLTRRGEYARRRRERDPEWHQKQLEKVREYKRRTGAGISGVRTASSATPSAGSTGK